MNVEEIKQLARRLMPPIVGWESEVTIFRNRDPDEACYRCDIKLSCGKKCWIESVRLDDGCCYELRVANSIGEAIKELIKQLGDPGKCEHADWDVEFDRCNLCGVTRRTKLMLGI